ncbi:hypothetical protein B0H14DRAFT_3892653 [Mycena olivaceomarginata]|nr:hypothetical protein B0H14DRAFT_3892653 [Mycena olivaceomarginata]
MFPRNGKLPAAGSTLEQKHTVWANQTGPGSASALGITRYCARRLGRWQIPCPQSHYGAHSDPSLAPLVPARHIDQDPDLTDDLNAYQETVSRSPMSELVDMSSFSFAAAGDHRVFVGRKETSLLTVELETGNIKAAIDSACPWDRFEDLREDDEVDLDELEGSKPPMSKPTEVFICGTDYHITIHTRPSSKHRIPVQNLSFSTYGPNSQGNILQGSYQRRGEGKDYLILWRYEFKSPIGLV